MKHLLALLAGLALANSNAAHAQADFRPGYIVTLTGDTLRGQADYRGALRSARLCRFRATPEASITDYRPAELRSYGFVGQKEYRAALIPMPDSLVFGQPSKSFFFLELLAAGPASLLARRGRNDETHYYLQKGAAAPVQELVYRRELVESNGQQYYRDDNAFRSTLSDAFADCPALSADVQKTLFKASALMALVNRYNQCRQPGVAVVVRTRPSHMSLGVLAGAQTGKLVYGGDQNQGAFTSDITPMFGLALHLVNPAISEKLAFRLELQYAQQQYESETSFASPFDTGSRQVRFSTKYLRLPFVVRYTLSSGKVRPLFEFGFAVNTALKIESGERIRFVSTLPYSNWEPALGTASTRKLEVGLLAGAGVQLGFPATRPLTLLARAERTTGFVTGIGNYTWHYHLLLGINLTK